LKCLESQTPENYSGDEMVCYMHLKKGVLRFGAHASF
jgi:hypothetical protein